MADTGYQSPTANGEDYSQWSNPAYAYSSDNLRASPNTLAMYHDYYNFGFSIPAGATIDGIQISLEGYAYNTVGADIYVELSWDSGDSYTSAGYYAHYPDTTEITIELGGAADKWGRAWAASEFSNANLRVRINDQLSGGTRPYLDHIQVKVYYTEVTGGFMTPARYWGA